TWNRNRRTWGSRGRRREEGDPLVAPGNNGHFRQVIPNTMIRAGRALPSLDHASSDYERHRDYVLAVLSRRCGWLHPSHREALFHDAYAVFLEKQRDGHLDTGVMRTPQVRAYLTQTALNKAMDEGKRAGRRRSVSLDDEDLGIDPIDPGRALDERLASSFDD